MTTISAKTKECRKCFTQIDERASICPNCRSKQPAPPRGMKGLVFFLVGGMSLAFWMASGGSNTTTKSATSEASRAETRVAARTREDLDRPKLTTRDDLETKMGRVFERDSYHLGQRLDRTSPGWWKYGEDLKPTPVDEKLTAEEIFANISPSPHVLIFFDLSGCKKYCDVSFSEEEKLRLWGLIRIHRMAAMMLYNNRCFQQTYNYDLKLIETQFRKLPADVQEKAVNREVAGIESVPDTNYGGVFSPGGWQWFCSKMNSDIKSGSANSMFATAREGR